MDEKIILLLAERDALRSMLNHSLDSTETLLEIIHIMSEFFVQHPLHNTFTEKLEHARTVLGELRTIANKPEWLS